MPTAVEDVFHAALEAHDTVPVAAMRGLIYTIENSTTSTWMELEGNLRQTIERLSRETAKCGRTPISVTGGCDQFMKFIMKSLTCARDVNTPFSEIKEEILIRGRRLADAYGYAVPRIASVGADFIQADTTILVHGESKVVLGVLLAAAESKFFRVLLTEGRPIPRYERMTKAFEERGIPYQILPDTAIGVAMESADLVIVGAEAVVSDGGIVNQTGTYPLALAARALNKPFYVAVQSYKFARMYPLQQKDVLDMFADATASGDHQSPTTTSTSSAAADIKENEDLLRIPPVDFTPASLVTLLFTNIGILTPAAVAEQIVRLYQ